MSHIRIGKGSTKGAYLLPGLDYRACKAVRAGDQVFLGGATGLKPDGSGLVGEGDPAAQADQAMKSVRTLLEQAGARMEDICKVTTYVTDISHRWKVYPVLAEHLRGVNPVSTGLVIPGLARPELDFEIDVFTVIPRDGGEHRRFRLFNARSKDPLLSGLDYGLARAVRANDMVYLQGQTGWTFDGDFVGLGDPGCPGRQRHAVRQDAARRGGVAHGGHLQGDHLRQGRLPPPGCLPCAGRAYEGRAAGINRASGGGRSAAPRSTSRSTSSLWLPRDGACRYGNVDSTVARNRGTTCAPGVADRGAPRPSTCAR